MNTTSHSCYFCPDGINQNLIVKSLSDSEVTVLVNLYKLGDKFSYMVVPTHEHVGSITKLSDTTRHALLEKVTQVLTSLELASIEYSVIWHKGVLAGQTNMEHAHVHIFPVFADSGGKPNGILIQRIGFKEQITPELIDEAMQIVEPN